MKRSILLACLAIAACLTGCRPSAGNDASEAVLKDIPGILSRIAADLTPEDTRRIDIWQMPSFEGKTTMKAEKVWTFANGVVTEKPSGAAPSDTLILFAPTSAPVNEPDRGRRFYLINVIGPHDAQSQERVELWAFAKESGKWVPKEKVQRAPGR